MYTENPMKDLYVFGKAFATNLLAVCTPSLYSRIAQDTGRGESEEKVQDLADYFVGCFDDYRDQLGLDAGAFDGYLAGKTVLEYGPGDILGVALLMYAHGAASVQTVDRFPLEKVSEKNRLVYLAIIDSLSGRQRERASSAFNVPGAPESGFKPECIRYAVTRDGLAGAAGAFDLVISRAVLEHVNDLEATLHDIARALKRGGASIHKVDLRSHGLDRYRPFDFLTWPDPVYKLMYSHKGFPNRWRLDRYKELIGNASLKIGRLASTGELEEEQIATIQRNLPRHFRDIPRDELSWLGFWVVLQHA